MKKQSDRHRRWACTHDTVADSDGSDMPAIAAAFKDHFESGVVREMPAENDACQEMTVQSSKYLNKVVETVYRELQSRVALRLGFKDFERVASSSTAALQVVATR